MTDVKLKHDAVTQVLFNQVTEAIAKFEAANSELLADDSGTSVRDIDKVLKNDGDDLPEDVKSAHAAAQNLYKQYRDAQESARNLYRTKVLGEEEKQTSDIDVDSLKELRKATMDTISFLQTYAKGNGKTDVLKWVETLQVPQIGRQGTSGVGTKKPRVLVTIGETTYDSFTEAAKGLSTKENKVTVPELTEAWNAGNGGEEGSFEFNGQTVTVKAKPKKSDSK